METFVSETSFGFLMLGVLAAAGFALLVGTLGAMATYRRTGDELYVRARVTSSELHPRPYREGDRQHAWTQPVWFQPGSD